MIHQDQGNLRSLLWAKVGEVCIDRNVDGTCGKKEEGACTLMEKLPAVTEAILKVRSDRMEPYIQSIRDNVCAYCESRDDDGSCDWRRTDQCMLNSYLPLIVEVIEEYYGRKVPGPATVSGASRAA